MKNFLKKFFEKTISLFFPTKCINCQREGSFLCQDCLVLITLFENNFCPICNSPKISFPGEFCFSCKKLFSLDGLLFATSYSEPIVKKAFSYFKYPPFIKNLADPLSFLIISQLKLKTNKFKNFLVSFVPITQKKRKFRGFNQSEEIAKRVSKALGLPVFSLLEKTKETRPQMELQREERRKNIEGVFSLIESRKKLVKGAKVLLIDDIFTTGATLNEAARVLKEGGAKKVFGVVIAREF
ncbi:MAG: ComF family protein [Candidatus Pacebacteria bacterium]|nr:ComF family protein [Candidatus Paceibacterota bacterium]